MNRRGSFNPWPWLPVMLIAFAAVPNTAYLIVAHRLHPTKVEDFPYLASARLDSEKDGAAAFAAAGYALEVAPVGTLRLRCALSWPAGATPPQGPAHVLLYRPDDPACDHDLAWADPARPLELTVQRAGRWRVCVLAARPDHAGLARLAPETVVEIAGPAGGP